MIFTVVDTETTGLNPSKHEIIEVAFISYIVDGEGNEYVLNKLEQKIKPEAIHLASEKALEINGYSKEKWKDAVEFSAVLPKLEKVFAESDFLIGQNLIFDMRFLAKMCERSGIDEIKFPPYVDTKALADVLKEKGVLKRTRMDYLCEHYNVTWEGRAHTALADCERTIKVFEKLQDEVPEYDLYTFEEPYTGY